MEELAECEAEHSRRQSDTLFELRLLTETFYHTAWRMINLLDHRDEPILGVQGLKKRCSGIRDVRNQLLEHPEGADSRIFIQSFSFGTLAGPQLKSIRPSGETYELEEIPPNNGFVVAEEDASSRFVDRGLYVNAEELLTALEKILGVSDP